MFAQRFGPCPPALADNPAMQIDEPLTWLGGLSAQRFMRRHWQKRPLVVRGGWPDARPPLPRAALFALAARDDVESRLVQRRGREWTLRHGPLPRRVLPPIATRRWTLLVQGLDLHVPAARSMLERFRFVPDARLDDLMVSWASDGGGVGPHVDAYDVFLIQVQGRRRWRIGRVDDQRFIDGLPLRILRRFEPEHDLVLEPGDVLYLPPRWGHDGVAVGECMTCSVGFRVPSVGETAREVLSRLADRTPGARAEHLYADPAQPATVQPARVPAGLDRFADGALRTALAQRGASAQALGEWLSEPKPQVWFESGAPLRGGVRVDARTRMLYDDRRVYVNGESWPCSGRDAPALRALADLRTLSTAAAARLSAPARALLDEWCRAGWMHGVDDDQS